MKNTILSKLVAKQDGVYKNYVFQNLDQKPESLFRYITVTVCPNWTNDDINIGECGFLEYELVEAGQDYFQRNTKEIKQYNFTTNYFINFVRQKNEEINKKYKF